MGCAGTPGTSQGKAPTRPQHASVAVQRIADPQTWSSKTSDPRLGLSPDAEVPEPICTASPAEPSLAQPPDRSCGPSLFFQMLNLLMLVLPLLLSLVHGAPGES